MTAHELARILLAGPDLPVATTGHPYLSKAHNVSHGALMVGILQSYAGPHVIIGNMLETLAANCKPNMWLESVIAPESAVVRWPEDKRRAEEDSERRTYRPFAIAPSTPEAQK